MKVLYKIVHSIDKVLCP